MERPARRRYTSISAHQGKAAFGSDELLPVCIGWVVVGFFFFLRIVTDHLSVVASSIAARPLTVGQTAQGHE